MRRIILAGAAIAVAALAVAGCASSASSTTTTVKTPQLPPTQFKVITDWTQEPNDAFGGGSQNGPYIRVVQINGQCYVESEVENGYGPIASFTSASSYLCKGGY